MHTRNKCFAGLLALMMVFASGATVQAGGIGGFLKKIPGVSTDSSKGSAKQPSTTPSLRTTRLPERLSNGQQMVTNDLRINTMVKGKVLLHGAPVKEYTTVYICPTSVTRNGNVFIGGFYGKAVTNMQGEFYVRAQPGTYKIYIPMSDTWGVFDEISTSNHGVTYNVYDFGFKPQWSFKE